MKQRFTTLDLVAAVAELQKTIVGQRLHNVYDIDGKTYLLRFASGESKHMVYIQSGTRIHLTEHEWSKNAMPGGFSMKLRKHVRQKRLESVTQLGIDRVIDMQFGSGELAFHLIIELYDRGNLILTDHTYKILIVLRKRVDEASDAHLEQDARYPIDAARKDDAALLEPAALQARCCEHVAALAKATNDKEAEEAEARQKNAAGKKNTQKNRNRTTLASVLNALFPFGMQLVSHALLLNDLRDAPIDASLHDAEYFHRVAHAMRDARAIFNELRNADLAHQGYLVRKQCTEDDEPGYEEYHPYKFAQLGDDAVALPSFNAAVDEFYSHAERQRSAHRAADKRAAAGRKLENVRRDHELRVRQLDAEVRACRAKAQTIEQNAEVVDKTIRIVNSLVAQQLGWEAIDEQVAAARRRDDPVATRIDKLLLERNQVALRFPWQVDELLEINELSKPLDDCPKQNDKSKRKRVVAANQQQDCTASDLIVEVDLGMSAYANVERFYELQKRAAEKAKRTLGASNEALRNAQRSYASEMAAAQRDVRILQRLATNVSAARRTLWFEKFRWFVSSDCYLVLAGATQSQNEILVKHYLKARDVYVHADLHGAASVVIKNPKGGPIPPRTLEEAGDFALCNSAAWESRLVSNAWWVHADQVSKTPPTGMYVSAGSFIIRGRKNYLRPTSLLFGFAFLFRLAPESVERRRKLAPSETAQVNETEELESLATQDIESDDEHEDSAAALRLAQLSVEDAESTTQQSSGTIAAAQLTDDRSDNLLDETAELNEPESQQQTDQDHTKRVISRAERRRLKKDRTDSNSRSDSISESTAKDQKEPPKSDKDKATLNAAPKRGQRSKLKKIKERYADQDDEERQLRMNILKGVGSARSERKQKEKEEQEHRARIAKEKAERAKQKKEAKEKQARAAQGQFVDEENAEPKPADDEDDGLSESDEEEQRPDQLTELLLSLNGNLQTDDMAMQAIPVCAPYAALNRYKFKVKLQPGTTKRSKAVKFALDVFLQDKNATDIEKALIKSVVEQDLSRNFPGKVKVSAPNLLRLHTKSKAVKPKSSAAN